MTATDSPELLFLAAFRNHQTGTAWDLNYMNQWMGSDVLRDQVYVSLTAQGLAHPFVQNIGLVHLTNKGYAAAHSIPQEVYESLIVTTGELKRLAHYLFTFEADQQEYDGYKKAFSENEIVEGLVIPKEKAGQLIKKALEDMVIVEMPDHKFIFGPGGHELVRQSLANQFSEQARV